MDTWILILSNYPMFGYMDSWISQFFVYPDTWIHGYLDIVDIMDTWILGYFNFFSFRIMDSQKSLDIQVSGYPTIRISHPYLNYYLSYDVCAVSVRPSFRPSVRLSEKKLLNGCTYQTMLA